MKCLWMRFGTLALLLWSVNACASGSRSPDVALCAEYSGLDVSLVMVFDLASSGLLGDRPSEVVTLTTPSEDLNPSTYFDHEGNFGIVLDEKDHRVTESTTYGQYRYEKVKHHGGTSSCPVFQRQGPKEKAFGNLEEAIYRVDGPVNEKIGEMSFQKFVTAEGEHNELATRMKGTTAWLVQLGQEIMQINADGKPTQVGWVGWRKVTTPQGKHLAILMTKSMSSGARWAGRFDGKEYRDK